MPHHASTSRALSPHEAQVERIYTENSVGFDGLHDGYLNFGLWEPGVANYLQAAEHLVRTLAEPLGLTSSARLLDVACGRGTQDLFVDRTFGPLQIDAVDVTRVHVEDARRRAALAGRAAEVRFHHASATQLPFDDGTFTHALAIEGPVHFDTRERFAAEAHRCLEPGGRIAIADYVLHRAPRNAVERAVLSATLSLWKIPVANAVTSHEYRAMLARVGFEAVTLREVGQWTIPGYYREQCRLDLRLHKLRSQGLVVGGLGFAVDIAAYAAFRLGLIEYVLVHARKPPRAGAA